jgi:hypothetical protein
MLAKLTREMPPAGDVIYEPKWDGFRCVVFRDGDELDLQSRNQKPLLRYFPELREPMLAQLPDRVVLDGMPLRLAVWQEALAAFRQELGLDISDTSEAAHLLLSLVALTWFPIVHGQTFLKAVGLDPTAPDFAEQRKRHITTLLLGALRERAANHSTWS